LSPLSPFGPEQSATIRANAKALARRKNLGISNPASRCASVNAACRGSFRAAGGAAGAEAGGNKE
jgi:hypothetical protein